MMTDHGNRPARRYGITAQIESHDPTGRYAGSQQVPTFYLDSSVQGIVSEAHAERIARDILTTPLRAIASDEQPTIHITVTTCA